MKGNSIRHQTSGQTQALRSTPSDTSQDLHLERKFSETCDARQDRLRILRTGPVHGRRLSGRSRSLKMGLVRPERVKASSIQSLDPEFRGCPLLTELAWAGSAGAF